MNVNPHTGGSRCVSLSVLHKSGFGQRELDLKLGDPESPIRLRCGLGKVPSLPELSFVPVTCNLGWGEDHAFHPVPGWLELRQGTDVSR